METEITLLQASNDQAWESLKEIKDSIRAVRDHAENESSPPSRLVAAMCGQVLAEMGVRQMVAKCGDELTPKVLEYQTLVDETWTKASRKVLSVERVLNICVKDAGPVASVIMAVGCMIVGELELRALKAKVAAVEN